MTKTSPPRSSPDPIGVRASCGYVTGILLHRALGEPLCGICVLTQEVLQVPEKPERNRARLEQAIGESRPKRRRPLPGEKDAKGYDFPSII